IFVVQKKESLEDKILVPEPDSSPCYAKCGTLVDGPYCRGCALLRKEFEEDLLTYCVENGIFQDSQDTFESSDDNTNVINVLQEPIVINQDPGVKSSQGPPLINQNCCYECGDSLDGFFCQQCICKFCGKGAHYGYNCPPKVLIISNPEQCNQTINELPQILPIVHPTCNFEAENSFAYDPNPNSFDNSPNFLTHLHNPSLRLTCVSYVEIMLIMVMIVHDSSCLSMKRSRVTIKTLMIIIFHKIHQKPPQDSVDYQGMLQVLNKMEEKLEEIIRDRRKKIEDMSIEEMMHEQQLVDREIKEIINDLGYKRFRGEEIDEEYERDCEIRIRKLKQDFNEWGSKDDSIPLGDIIARYSTSKAITPDLPIEESENSLIMGDEPLSTIPATESDEVIKSSVENLVPIPSEFEVMSDDTSDVPNIDPILEEFAGELAHIAPIPPGIVEADFDPNDDTSSDDDSFENIEYVDASPSFSELDSLEEENKDQEEKEFDLEDIFQIQDVILRHVFGGLLHFLIPVRGRDHRNFFLFSNNSLPEFESFSDHTEETRSGSTTTHANYSLPEGDENVVVPNVEEDNSFTFFIRTFLPFITYPEVSPLSSSTRSEDTIFDPGIFA
ncbi:hypothetical protein Tco_1005781, partial [Tanacetum coccineum]